MGKTYGEVNDYNRDRYDRVNIMIPKGRRQVWKTVAAAMGLSMNSLVNRSVEEKIAAFQQRNNQD